MKSTLRNTSIWLQMQCTLNFNRTKL